MKKTAVDFHTIEPNHSAIHTRLVNWARYVAVHPRSITQPMWRAAKTSRQWDIDPHIKIEVDILDGHILEKAVYKLPEPMRGSVRWWYVTREGVTVQRKAQGLTAEGLQKAVRDGRQMLINSLKRINS